MDLDTYCEDIGRCGLIAKFIYGSIFTVFAWTGLILGILVASPLLAFIGFKRNLNKKDEKIS